MVVDMLVGWAWIDKGMGMVGCFIRMGRLPIKGDGCRMIFMDMEYLLIHMLLDKQLLKSLII